MRLISLDSNNVLAELLFNVDSISNFDFNGDIIFNYNVEELTKHKKYSNTLIVQITSNSENIEVITYYKYIIDIGYSENNDYIPCRIELDIQEEKQLAIYCLHHMCELYDNTVNMNNYNNLNHFSSCKVAR